ncbi:MAG: aminodeoxychorismate/anthranilate synthase component II [Deltaproteobacteria bacterium]|nr:aminodeoxychorismate/anthranilate synthase component II [Deltaproteobacteria bacterium]
MILLIDNYDSFTYNLVQLIEPMGQEVKVYRNDEIDIPEISLLSPDRLMISPGPCTPAKAGISINAIKEFGKRIPTLGVCLGHQAIGEAYGGVVIRAGRIMHGKTSMIFHDEKGIFRGIPNPFEAVRYHSLLVEKNTLPACFEISAWTDEGEIMGLRHKEHPVNGVQFHPESILTDAGDLLLNNFINLGGNCL